MITIIKNVALIIYLSLLFYNSVYANSEVKAPLFNNIGTIDFPISTKSPLAKRYFEQGLILYYAFEWGDSIRSFQEAARLDPNCGMCYWGIALSTSGKMNAPLNGNEYDDSKKAIEKAQSLKQSETPVEQEYIQALAQRFKHPSHKNVTHQTGTFRCHLSSADMESSSKDEILDYINGMRKLSQHYPDDQHAKALMVYALFDYTEWSFWDEKNKINKYTPEMIQTLKSVLAKDPNHIGANHYFIHVMEQSENPEEALESAKRLETLVPGSEHLNHMPSHIYFRTGQYHKAVEANQKAIATVADYNKFVKAQGFAPQINHNILHNHDFLRYAAVMEGNKKLALSAALQMMQEPFPTYLKNEPELQWFIPIPYYVEVRFAMWNDILKEKMPNKKYQYSLGMWHYARGVAFTHLNQIKKAKNEAELLKNIIKKGPTEENLQQNGVKLLNIADRVLSANIAHANHDEKSTLANLKEAMEIQDNMRYHEPPDWYFPVSEALGSAYLNNHDPAKAVEMFQKDLKEYPKNAWALFGLAQALKENGKVEEAKQVYQQYKAVWANADVSEPILLFAQHN